MDEWVLCESDDLGSSQTIQIENHNGGQHKGLTETDLLYPETNPHFHLGLGESQYEQGIPFETESFDGQVMNRVNDYVPPHYSMAYAPFDIQEEEAREIFQRWKEEQWFAPKDFSAVSEGRLYAFLVPYHCFSTQCHSTFSGKIGYKNVTTSYNASLFKGRRRGNNGITVHENIDWQGSRVMGDNIFSNVMYCGSVVEEDKALLNEIDNWDIGRVVHTYSHQESLGPCTNWSIACDEFMSHVKKTEYNRASSVLKQANGADIVENISVDVVIPTVQRCLVYMPVYYFGYQYEDKEFKFFINGQNGKVKGTRPMGLGMIGRGFEKLGSLVAPIFMSKEEKALREDWKQIQKTKKN